VLVIRGLAVSNAEILIYIFLKQNIRKQFDQTALGNCCGLKSANADCSFKKEFIVLFIRIFGTFSFRILAPHYRFHHALHNEQLNSCYMLQQFEYAINTQQQPLSYGHYTGQPALTGTSS